MMNIKPPNHRRWNSAFRPKRCRHLGLYRRQVFYPGPSLNDSFERRKTPSESVDPSEEKIDSQSAISFEEQSSFWSVRLLCERAAAVAAAGSSSSGGSSSGSSSSSWGHPSVGGGCGCGTTKMAFKTRQSSDYYSVQLSKTDRIRKTFVCTAVAKTALKLIREIWTPRWQIY